MKIWINKGDYSAPSYDFMDAIVFNMLDDNPKSNLKTNFEEFWRRFSAKELEPIYEDLLVLAASVYATDKRVPRGGVPGCKTYDNWTRKLELCVPVINKEQWMNVKDKLEAALSFLSGDAWTITFRKTEKRYRNVEDGKKYKEIKNGFDGVSLFSGGLDSFSGAIRLLESHRNICFVGFMEYKQLNNRIIELFQLLKNIYTRSNIELIVFSTNPKVPNNINDELSSIYTENTSRSRSFLFLAGAIAVASMIGNSVPVYIPENGFIGINLPLTPSRVGSCSTRTTHVYFLRLFNDILESLKIHHKVENFYALKTKGEIVEEVKHTEAFLKGAGRTISCSHPTQGRGATVPINCGYCFPCLIRRAALHKVGYSFDYYLDQFNPDYKLSSQFLMNKRFSNSDTGRVRDLKATLLALHRYIKNDDKDYYTRQMISLGGFNTDDIEQFSRVYFQSMEELKEMIKSQAYKNDLDLLNFIGLNIRDE